MGTKTDSSQIMHEGAALKDHLAKDDPLLGTYKINLNKFNITSFTPVKPYVYDDYLKAVNNQKGITAAIKYAYDNAYSRIVLPKGNYPLTYTNENNISIYSNDHTCINVENVSNLEIDLNGSKLDVMFDSENRNPFDKGTTYQPMNIKGNPFRFKIARNNKVL